MNKSRRSINLLSADEKDPFKCILYWTTMFRHDCRKLANIFLQVDGPSARLYASSVTYTLLTKCEVKVVGYWLSSFFCVFMDRDGVEVHKLEKQQQQQQQGQYPAILTSQAGQRFTKRTNLFSCGIERVVPSEQDGAILPARVVRLRS